MNANQGNTEARRLGERLTSKLKALHLRHLRVITNSNLTFDAYIRDGKILPELV